MLNPIVVNMSLHIKAFRRAKEMCIPNLRRLDFPSVRRVPTFSADDLASSLQYASIYLDLVLPFAAGLHRAAAGGGLLKHQAGTALDQS